MGAQLTWKHMPDPFAAAIVKNAAIGMGVFMTDRIETERMLREREACCDAAAERRVVYVIDLNEISPNMGIRLNPIDQHVSDRVGMKRIAVGRKSSPTRSA
jgi:hypothetical protein